ncbi:hypothetical protein WJX77_004862 [Trebouxia sp. C0004]
MSSVSVSDELDARLALSLDPFEEMCGPKSQNSVPSWKNTLKASKSPVKKALMLRAPSSQTISDIALLQREKTQLCQQMNQLESWVKGAESRHGNLIKANRHMRCTLEKADKELEMSRLKHDKLLDMLAAANAAQQAAEQKSRRLEIKFARSDKGHALMRSAKLQASVAELEAQVSQLQDDSHLKGEMLASSQAKVVELHNALSQHAHKAGITDQQLIVDNARMSVELESSMQYCQECEGQLSSLRQQSELSDETATEAAAEAAKLQDQNERLSQQLQDLKQKSSDAHEKAEASSRTHQAEVAQLHLRMQAAASRGAEEVDELRAGYEDRMSAMRAELQQQEVDKAALLDIVQDLEEKCSGEALIVAQASTAAAHDQVSQLRTQLQQAQARASAMSNAEAQERDSWQQERLTLLGRAKAADAEAVRLRQSAEGLKQESQKGLIEMRKATQQWAVAQADLRSTRHQLKILQSQASGLSPAPVTPDTPNKKEVAALKEQLDKLLNDLEAKSHELQATSQARADLQGVLKQAAEGHCLTESTLNAQIAALRSELKLKTHELQAESQARAEVELALKAAAQGNRETKGQTITALQQDLEFSSRRVQALETVLADQQQMLVGTQQELAGKQQELAGLQQDLAGLQQKLAGVQQDLEGKQQEVQAAGQAYAELEEVLTRASEEQIVCEDKLVAQINGLQDEVKELRGVHGACEALEQTVAQLKQRLVIEASKQMDLTGKLEAASRGPAEVQMQLQQAQQQNQTLARILAERCEQAAAHVQNEQQLQGVWQELVEIQAVPSGATVQEQGMYLKQQLAAFFDQLKAKDAELSVVQQQLQQAQQAQRAQQSNQPSRQDTVHDASFEVAKDVASSLTTLSPSTLAASQRLPSRSILSTVSARHVQSRFVPLVSGDGLPQLRAVSTSYTDSLEVTNSNTPRHQLVAQRIKELQSRQSSPEKSLSSSSSLGLSPRTELRGEFDRSSRAGHVGDTVNSPRARAAGTSLRAEQMDNSIKEGLSETAFDARPDSSSFRAGPSEVARDSPSASSTAHETVQRAFDSSSREVASGMTPQQSRRVTSTSGVSDDFGAPHSARRDSKSVTPPSGRMSPELQRISPMSFLMPSDPKQAAAYSDDSLTWGVGVEVGSPGLELPSDEESETGSRHAGDAEMAQGRVTQAARDGGGAVVREDSAQFGPEACAMSLPGDGECAGASAALSDAKSLRSISDGGSEPEDGKQSNYSTAARPPTLKQQLSDLHSSFKQMRARYTPPHSRSLSRQSSLGGI